MHCIVPQIILVCPEILAVGTPHLQYIYRTTTLQVEHPVTEWISNVNIPSCQLLIGMGVPLHRIPDIRRLYGQDPAGASPINFDTDAQTDPSGEPQNCLYNNLVMSATISRASLYH